MIRTLTYLLGLALLPLLLAHAAAPLADGTNTGRPSFQVVDGGWGGSEPAEIGKVLVAVADQFPSLAADNSTPSIRIRHRFGGPMIKYDRDRDRSVVVYLSARDSRWYQFVYQFAHEYCHLLSNFARKQQHGDDILRDHQWFEEALCETASLYALRRLAVKWCDPTAEPMLREAAPKLAQYSRQLLAEPHRQLAAGTSFAAWYARNQQALERDPYMRESNELAATQLLPLFEAEPTRWAALAYLNPLNRAPGQSFADFLAAWSAASPPRLRALVAEIRTLFGMQPASGPSGPNDASRTRPLPGTATECGS